MSEWQTRRQLSRNKKSVIYTGDARETAARRRASHSWLFDFQRNILRSHV